MGGGDSRALPSPSPKPQECTAGEAVLVDGASRMTQPQLSTTSKILPPLPPRALGAVAGYPGCSPSLTAAALPRLVLLTETRLDLNHFWKGFF